MLISRTVQHGICEKFFWRDDSDVLRGPVVHLKYRSQGEHIYVWSDDIRKLKWGPGGAGHGPPVGEIFDIVAQGQQGYVLDWHGYAIDTQAGMDRFLGNAAGPGTVRSMRIDVPADCTPRFDGASPWKEGAIDRILQGVAEQARTLGWRGKPKDLEVVIGNFNFDYREAHVYVPALNKYMEAQLRYGLKSGQDITGLDNVAVFTNYHDRIRDWVKPKILKYGIRRTIHWNG